MMETMTKKSKTENVLESSQAIMTATIHIKRAATGKVDEYKLDFIPLPDEQTTDEQTKGAE